MKTIKKQVKNLNLDGETKTFAQFNSNGKFDLELHFRETKQDYSPDYYQLEELFGNPVLTALDGDIDDYMVFDAGDGRLVEFSDSFDTQWTTCSLNELKEHYNITEVA